MYLYDCFNYYVFNFRAIYILQYGSLVNNAQFLMNFAKVFYKCVIDTD